ncbi:hypothetical protein [Jiangella anatolica]|nr:hypothetical protein [Jiangella anatolica]
MVELPRPENWARPPIGGWFMTVFLAFVALQCLFGTAVSIAAGNWVTAAGAAGAALVAGALARHVLPRRHRPVGPPVRVDIARVASWGLRFPVRTISPAAAVAFLVAGLAAALVTGAMAGSVDGGWDRAVILTIGAGAVAALVGSGFVGLAAWGRSDAIELTPSHLVLRVSRHPVVLEWEQVRRISSAARRQGLMSLGWATPNCVVVEVSPVDLHDEAGTVDALWRQAAGAPPGSVATILTSRLVNDPVLVYWALRFYLQHPECRHELAGGTALHRLRAGEVLA